MSKNIILAFDPGIGGGYALYGNRTLKTFYMPTRKSGRKNKVNTKMLVEHLRPYAPRIKMAVTEKVGVMTGDEGVVAMFNFGYGAGILEGVVTALDIPMVKLNPAVWKPGMGLNRDKTVSLKLARKLFPQHTEQFALKRDDGRAEAALMAYFAERNL